LKDIDALEDKAILFIDELHLLVGAGSSGEGGMDASNMLKPALARGELRCMGATTLDEYRKYIEKDAALARRFQPVLVTEPSLEDTISILRGLKEKYEVFHGIRIADAALVRACKLAERYLTERKMPDKAIDLIDEAAARLRMQQESKPDEIEAIERELIRKRIEIEALRKESDWHSKQRLRSLEKEVEKKSKIEKELLEKWNSEKNILQQMKDAQQELDMARREAEVAQTKGDFARAGELVYSLIPELEAKVKEFSTATATEEQMKKIKQINKTNQLENHQDTPPYDKKETKRETENKTYHNTMLGDVVTEAHIAEVVAKQTGIPVGTLLAKEADQLLHLEDRLQSRVIGQSDAVVKIADAVRVSRAGLRDTNRPIGVFLFLGPTGVGKTELSKALCEELFQDSKAMTRVDMSEYMERFNVSRLVGAPPGYIGHEEGGTLTEAVRRRPFQLVLLDEFEKAHKDVSNLLLQVLDEGRLTDSHGRTVDFKNTILILTSNVGSDILAGASTLMEEEEQEKDLEKQYYERQKEQLQSLLEEVGGGEGEQRKRKNLGDSNPMKDYGNNPDSDQEEEDLFAMGMDDTNANSVNNKRKNKNKTSSSSLSSSSPYTSLPLSKTEKLVREEIMNRVRATFSPEFINRLDDIIVFNRLDKGALLKVLDLELLKVEKKLEENNDILFHVDTFAKEWLLHQGYDPAYGARPIRRTIQAQVLNPLARLLISGNIKDGSILHLMQVARRDIQGYKDNKNDESYENHEEGVNLADGDEDIVLSEDTESNNMFPEALETDQLIILRKIGMRNVNNESLSNEEKISPLTSAGNNKNSAKKKDFSFSTDNPKKLEDDLYGTT
jgi:ATP-dependent Clp protease ATP-binding subunit ClpA